MKIKDAVACIAIGCCIGYFTTQGPEERLITDTAIIHHVKTGETIWDIARPVADANGLDIREVVWTIKKNNNLGNELVITPGQKLVIR